MKRFRAASLLAMLWGLIAAPAGAVDLSFSAFGTAGYSVSDQPYAYQRWIDNTGTFTRDSLAGVQFDARLTETFGATVQLKLAPDTTSDNQYEVTVPWAFVSWRPSNDWLFRLGKQRIPLYLYSQTVDVGVTYDFARLPTEMYSITTSNDITGISVSKTWAIEDGELSLDAYWGKSSYDIRFWIRDNVPPLQSSGALFATEDLTGGGFVLSYKRGEDTVRGGVHRATYELSGGTALPISATELPTTYPFVVLAPGIGYYQVLPQLPGPGIPTVASLTATVYTLGVDVGLGSGFRAVGELARVSASGSDISPASTRGYASLLKKVDKWTPYVSYAFLRSASRQRDFYLDVNYNAVPGFIPGAALINASQRTGADYLLSWDQYSWSIGTSYSINAANKIKAEFQRAHIGQMSGMVDAPSGTNVTNQNINLFTINYSFVF